MGRPVARGETMKQSNWLAGGILLAFVIFETLRGVLPDYREVLGI